jgi:hypothetical protein
MLDGQTASVKGTILAVFCMGALQLDEIGQTQPQKMGDVFVPISEGSNDFP